MPKLPSADDFGVGVPSPSRGQVNIRGVQLQPDYSGAQVLASVADTALTFEKRAQQEADKLDSLKAEEALNKIRQARLDLTIGDTGAYKAQGGQVLDTTYASGFKSRFDTATQGVLAGLTPAQQAKLKPHADREAQGFQTDILRHSMTEAERYHGIVREGSATTSQNLAVAQWQDPINFTAQLGTLNDIAMAEANKLGITGKTDEEKATLTALRQKRMSPAFVGAITQALDAKDPASLQRAEDLFNQGGMLIDPNARLQLGSHIQKAKDTIATQQEAKGFMSSVVVPANTPMGKFTEALKGAITTTESGGAKPVDTPFGPNIMGPVIQSGANKGQQAVGPHQIMPASAKQDAKEAGIPWDEKLFYSSTTPEGRAYHDKLQAAHVDRLTKMFKTPVEVAAAYNAGEGNVLEAQKKFDTYQRLYAVTKGTKEPAPLAPKGYTGRPEDITFLDFLPKPGETKPYVAKVMSRMGSAPDIVAPTSREIEATMAAKFPGRPDLAANATKLVEHQLKLAEEQRKAEVDTAKEQIYKVMGQGNKTVAEIPPSLFNKLPVKDQDEVRATFDAHLSKVTRDSSASLLYRINTEPTYLQSIPTSAWTGPMRTSLSEYDWQRLDKQRSAALGGNAKEVENLDSGTIHNILASRLRMLDIEPKASDKTGMAIVNSSRAVIDQSILEQQKALGRKLTEVETMKHIDNLFATSDKLKASFLPTWLGGSPDRAKSVLALNYGDIPSDERSKIKAELVKKGVSSPTDVQILTTYKQIRQGLL